MNAARPSSGFTRTLESLNCDDGRGVALLALCALLIAPELGGEPVRLALRYERVAVGAGEWWRLFTAHIVHLHLEHALLNVLGLVLMWMLFARDFTPARWGAVIASSVLVVDGGLWFGEPMTPWYVGASGVLHGVMAAGTVAHLRRREADAWLLLGFLAAKLAYEQSVGTTPLAPSADPVIVSAHLYGALGGFVAALARSAVPDPRRLSRL